VTRRPTTGCTHARFRQRLHAPAPEPAQRKPFLSQAGEGESVWSLGDRFTAKATAAVTEGRFALVGSVAFRSAEPPLHIHHREGEAWYILDGKMMFYVGDAVIEATAGCFAFAPRGIPYTFTVDVGPTRVLVFASPAGFEHFALKLREEARGDTPPAGLAVPGRRAGSGRGALRHPGGGAAAPGLLTSGFRL
jgi:mannose-6-phosphate isomerase-like protein (cupin superfamily)